MKRTYRVEEVPSASPVRGSRSWGVFEDVDGVTRGIDFHWVREDFAHRAAEQYRSGCPHGAGMTSREVLDWSPEMTR